MMPRLVCFLIAIAALALLSPACYQVWTLSPSGPHPAHLSAESRLAPSSLVGDLDGDNSPEQLIRKFGHLSIQSDKKTLWDSPSSWIVQQGFIADLDHDQKPEVVLLVSRPFRPWPVDAWLPVGGRIESYQDSRGFSSHIILIGWDGGSFRELWAGSAMADPAKQIAVARMEDHGEVLVTLEARYDDPVSYPARRVKVWEWNGFGFSLVSALNGSFRRLEIHEDRIAQYLILFR